MTEFYLPQANPKDTTIEKWKGVWFISNGNVFTQDIADGITWEIRGGLSARINVNDPKTVVINKPIIL